MGVFDKALNNVKRDGSNMANAAIKMGSNAGTAVQDNTEIANLKMQINSIDQELNASYAIIGRKYAQYVAESGDMPGIDVTTVLKEIDPKVTRKEDLEKQLVDAEKRVKDANLLRDKRQAEEEFEAEKSKLDRALSMDVINQDEYNLKFATAQKKLDKFEEVRNVQAQFDLGLISKEEMNAKISQLLN